ncbi:acyltransferase family protein [Vibrio alginolyticus]
MRIQSLQVLRGVAAWAVVYHHYMQIFYNFESSNYIGEIFSQRGGFGVDLFFVLSGFVMFIAATRSSVNAKEFF